MWEAITVWPKGRAFNPVFALRASLGIVGSTFGEAVLASHNNYCRCLNVAHVVYFLGLMLYWLTL